MNDDERPTMSTPAIFAALSLAPTAALYFFTDGPVKHLASYLGVAALVVLGVAWKGRVGEGPEPEQVDPVVVAWSDGGETEGIVLPPEPSETEMS